MSCGRSVAIVLLLGQTACGYTLAGRGTFLPDHIRSIGVPPFDSAVPRPGVADKFTEAVTRELIARGSYRVVPNATGVEAVLVGRLTGLLTTPIAFDESGRATRTLLTASASVTVRDLGERKVLYENPAFQFRTEIELSDDPDSFYDPESEAMDELANQFARSLVSAIVEGF